MAQSTKFYAGQVTLPGIPSFHDENSEDAFPEMVESKH
jgi:hypothetical protein